MSDAQDLSIEGVDNSMPSRCISDAKPRAEDGSVGEVTSDRCQCG